MSDTDFDTVPDTDLALPPLYCPIEPAIYPRVPEIHRRAEEWIEQSGLCATDRERRWIVATHSADFFGRFAPNAADDERLLATSLWVYWGFAFDDAYCDSPPLNSRPDLFVPLAARVQRALESPHPARRVERVIPPLQDIAGRLRSLGTSTQVSRFFAAHRRWLSGVAWQISNESRGRIPDLNEYLPMRLLVCGVEPPFAMLELATGVEVPDRELHQPAVRALTEMAVAVVALDNDRQSLRKEMVRGQTGQNIYRVLMRHQPPRLADAVAAATRLRDRILNRFLQLCERVRHRAGFELDTYLQGLCHGIRGNAEWGLRVPRYLSLGRLPGAYDHDAKLEWADSPAYPRADPLPLPSVAWWWDRTLD